MENNHQNTALLVMDMQQPILGMLPNAVECINKVAIAIAHARAKNIPVIYVVLGFRQGAPEINLNNKRVSSIRERLASANMEEWMKICDEVAPLPGEIMVVKRRVSAFSGSDLEVVLRAKGIQHMVLTGVATSGVVLSTVCEAADKDYKLTVLSDGCADADEEMHRVLTTKTFLRPADVMTVEEWCK